MLEDYAKHLKSIADALNQSGMQISVCTNTYTDVFSTACQLEDVLFVNDILSIADSSAKIPILGFTPKVDFVELMRTQYLQEFMASEGNFDADTGFKPVDTYKSGVVDIPSVCSLRNSDNHEVAVSDDTEAEPTETTIEGVSAMEAFTQLIYNKQNEIEDSDDNDEYEDTDSDEDIEEYVDLLAEEDEDE